MKQVFEKYEAFGFSGSREVVPVCASVLVSNIPTKCKYIVGCAKGVDAFFRDKFACEVFYAKDYPAFNYGASLALRSLAFVRGVDDENGLLCSFPDKACPVGLVPKKNPFDGKGSGTWATLAYAIFCRVDCLVFLPHGFPFPKWNVNIEKVEENTEGVFFYITQKKKVVELSLF